MKYSNKDLSNMAAQDIFDRASLEVAHKIGRLRSCSADVWESENFYLLRSYATFIGAIEKSTGYGSDMLRHEYGYTATSAQHLAKFFADYGDRNKVYRWNY